MDSPQIVGYASEAQHFLLLMLIGQELLAEIKQSGHLPKTELVRLCGYVKNNNDGTERVLFTQFYEALLEAKGVPLSKNANGRKLSGKAKVQFNGNLIVGRPYLEKLGFNPGDVFEIKLGRNSITLTPVGSDDATNAESQED